MMEEMEGIKNSLSLEQQERQERFVILLDLMKSISERTNSNITSEFIDFLDENNLKFKDYFLANLFAAVVRGNELPEETKYKFYDTKDGKIESFMKNLSLVESSR